MTQNKQLIRQAHLDYVRELVTHLCTVKRYKNKELAAITKMSISSVKKWRAGTTAPRLKTLAVLEELRYITRRF